MLNAWMLCSLLCGQLFCIGCDANSPTSIAPSSNSASDSVSYTESNERSHDFPTEPIDSNIVFEGMVDGLDWAAKDSASTFVYYPQGQKKEGIPLISFTFRSSIPNNDWKIVLTSHQVLEPGKSRWPSQTFDVQLIGKFRDGNRKFRLEDPPVEAYVEITESKQVEKNQFLVSGHLGCEVFDPAFRDSAWIDGEFRKVRVKVMN